MYKRKLDDWIKSFLYYTRNSEAPTIYRKWTAFSTIASVLGRKCYLEWDCPTYANMYIVLIGPSGVGKNTAMWPAKQIINQLDINVASESVIREQLINEIEKSTSFHLDNGIQVFTTSITIFSQEFTVFIGYDKRQLIMDLTDWYDCPDLWRYSTKNSGRNILNNLYVNMIAATTPKLLGSTLSSDATGGGLTARMIFVYAQERGSYVAMPWLYKLDEKLKDDLISDLANLISPMQGMFRLDNSFIDLYVPWYENPSNHKIFPGDFFEGYERRRPKHLLKLCMVLNASCSEEMVLTKREFNEALVLLEEVEAVMPRAFAGIGESDISELIERITQLLIKRRTVTYSELVRYYYNDADGEKINRAVSSIVTMKRARMDRKPGAIDYTLSYAGNEK